MEVRRDYLAWTPAEREQKADGVAIVPQLGIEGHQTIYDNIVNNGSILRTAAVESGAAGNTPAERLETEKNSVEKNSVERPAT